MKFPVVVEVSPRPGIADPEAATIERALPALGFTGVDQVRTGRAFRLRIEAASADEALSRGEEMAKRLLSNPVIEQSAVRLEGASA